MKLTLIFLIFTFLKSASSSLVGISARKSSWMNALSHDKNLLTKKYIATSGWDSLKPHLQENVSYWIGARGNYTDFVSWAGCIERHDSSGMNTECMLTKYEDSGSVSKCFANCKSDYFALQGNECYCLSGEQRRDCIIMSSKDCQDRCKQNPNDFCGGHKDVMALYNKVKLGNLTFNESIRNEGDCLVLLYKHQKPTYKQAHCLTSGRRYICNEGANGTSHVVHDALITWQQAFNLCRQKQGGLAYIMTYKREFFNSYFWTSLRRSLDLNWTTNTGGPKQCAALTKKVTSGLVVTLEDCKKELSYIYVQEDERSKEEGWESLHASLLVPLVLTCIAMSAAIGTLCYFRYRTMRWCRNESGATDESTEPAVAFNVYAEPEPIYNTTMKVPEPANSNYEKVTSDDVINNGGYDVANCKGSLKTIMYSSGYGYGMATGKIKAQTDYS